MRSIFLLPCFCLVGCALGVSDSGEPATTHMGSAANGTCAVRITGTIEAMGEPLAGAVVIGYGAAGKRTGKAVTGTDGTYYLLSCGEPARMAVKAPHRVPRVVPDPELLAGGPNEWEFNLDVGPVLGADGTGRLLTYMVRSTASSVQVVPQVGWGGSGIGSPHEDLFDLMQGPRVPQLMTLVPRGTALVPSLEESLRVIDSAQGQVLELRLSEHANSASLGSAFEAAYITQLVATACVNAGEDRLPVRIRVRCPTCADGWSSVKDGHLGPDGPLESYRCEAQAPGESFPDIANHRYAREIAMAKGIKLAWSVGDGTFRPDEPVTRADMAFLLVSALGLPIEQPCSSALSDVPSDAWYCGYVEAARARGLASGDAQGRFRPWGSVTRAELASYLVRAAGWPAHSPEKATFHDVPTTYWAFAKVETAHAWCHAMEPRVPGSVAFEPASKATRAEAMSGIVRMLECLTGDEVAP